LLAIGEQRFPERISTLRREIRKLSEEGTLGTHVYNLEQRDFIAKQN
jgi:ribosomal protein L19E